MIIRVNAVQALWKQLELTKSPERIEAICLTLKEALRDDDVAVRTYAAIALGLHKALFTPEISILFGAVKNEKSNVRERNNALRVLEKQLGFIKSVKLKEAICFALEAAP